LWPRRGDYKLLQVFFELDAPQIGRG